jgi:hypothetical protein
MTWNPVAFEDHDEAPEPAAPKPKHEPKAASALPLQLSVGATPELTEAMAQLTEAIAGLIKRLDAVPQPSHKETSTTT